MGIIEYDFKSQEDEITNSTSSLPFETSQNVRSFIFSPVAAESIFRERSLSFSLDLQEI